MEWAAFPPPGYLPNPRIEPTSLASTALQADSLLAEPPGKPQVHWKWVPFPPPGDLPYPEIKPVSLTCIQISQETGKVVWYFHLFKNFPVCCDLHSQGFSIVSEAEVDFFFLELLCSLHDPINVGNLTSGSSPSLKPSLYMWKLLVPVLLKPAVAAAKSLQLCPTLCDPIDRSPPGSSVPGILQARTLEWVAISFSNA